MPTSVTPPFARCGLHLDFRVQVMPYPALIDLAREVAALGLNTLMVEWEASYPFRKHPLLSNSYAYTREEITSFVAECTRLGIDVIPLQQCFGHIEYILAHAPYAHLRESPRDFCQLCPCKGAEAVELFEELFADIASTHPSPYFHIGGDETYLLGHCPECRKRAEVEGKSKLYVDYFRQIAEIVIRLGKRPLLWADMLLKNPEAAREMPRESIFVDWNYGWEPNYFGDLGSIHGAFEIWGAPALRCHPDNHSLTVWPTHFNNLRDFLPFAREAGYQGMILTSWSTSGIYGHHWNTSGEVLELLPMRRVYPLSGFRILYEAFAVALRSPAFDPEAFVIGYAGERFGLSPEGGAALWQVFHADATLLDGRQSPGELEAMAKSAREAVEVLAQLAPTRHEEEFEHFRLMASFRDLHVRFAQVEEAVGREESALLVEKLVALRSEATGLAERYARSQAGFLYPAEIAEENRYRSVKMARLHERLARSGRC